MPGKDKHIQVQIHGCELVDDNHVLGGVSFLLTTWDLLYIAKPSCKILCYNNCLIL